MTTTVSILIAFGVYLLGMTGIVALAGQVKLDNLPSQKAFEKAGYEEFLRNDRYVEYRKKLEK